MHSSQRTVCIEWGDCDPARIVFYPNYFRWFDASTAHHFDTAGLSKPELVAQYNVVGFPMVDTRAIFHVPCQYGDEVVITTTLTRFGRSSFDVAHQLHRSGELAVEGFEKRVLVRRANDGQQLESCPIPESIKALFERSS